MKPAVVWLSLVVVAFVTACSGAGVPSMSGGTIGASNAANHVTPDRRHRKMGKARVHIRIPHRKRRIRHGHYISPGTQSIAITVAGVTTITNLTPTSPGCSTPGSYTQCTITVSAPLGANVLFQFVTYDQLNATGNKLSANNVASPVVQGSPSPLNVTLGGIATGITFAGPPVPAVTGSQSSGFNIYGKFVHDFSIVTYDADGYSIIGPGAPTIKMTAPPASSKLGVATPSPGTPNNWPLISSYTATDPSSPQPATLTAVSTPVPGSGGATITRIVNFNLYQPWIYVTDVNDGSLYVFDEQGNPITLGPNAWAGIPSPTGISYDPNNHDLYMAGQGDSIVYQTDLLGNLVTPAAGAWANVGDPQTALYAEGGVFVANGSGDSGANISTYDVDGIQATPSGGFPNPGFPSGLAFDPLNGFIYDAGGGLTTPAVVAYDTNGTPKTLASNFGGLVQANSIAYDSNTGNLYVGSIPSSSIGEYDENGAALNLTGFSGLTTPNGIVYDPYDGLIYVADGGGGASPGIPSSIKVFDESGAPQSITFNETFDTAFGITVVP